LSVWVCQRYILALLGATLAMGGHLYISTGTGDWLAPQRIGSSLGGGLIFGHLVAWTVILVGEIPRIWQARVWRILLAVCGVLAGTLSWWSYSVLILYNTSPDWVWLALGGAALAAGFLWTWQWPYAFRVVFTSGLLAVPVITTYQLYLITLNTPSPNMALLYFNPSRPQLIPIAIAAFVLLIALFGHIRPNRAA